MSLLAPVSDTDFYALLCGGTHFALLGSSNAYCKGCDQQQKKARLRWLEKTRLPYGKE